MTGARRDLLLAGLLLAGSVAAGGLAAAVLLDGPLPVALLGLLPLLLALAAGRTRAGRRAAARVLAVAAATAALVAALGLALVVAVLVLGRVPRGDDRAVLLAGLAGTTAAVLLAGALRRSVRRRVAPDGQRTPEEVLRTIGDRASRGVPLEELLLQLVESLRRVQGLSGAEVWTRSGGTLTRLLGSPQPTGASPALGGDDLTALRRVPVAGEGWLGMWLPALLEGRAGQSLRLAPALHAGELLGLLVVTRPADAAPFAASDERALVEVARRLGVLLRNRALDAALQASLDELRRTNDELRASRSRLVAAADAERRRIERDLHDGAQQHLVAMAIDLGLAADLVESDPAAARDVVEQARADARTLVRELRDLAHGIYPALLLDGGLGPALRSLATRHAGLEVQVADVGRCAPAVEAAVWFCCLEALQNAAKHAGGAAVRLSLTRDADVLRAEVSDEGPGLPSQRGAPAGQGLQNMVDRMGAVGGRAQWRAGDPVGTRVVLEVPLEPARVPA